MFWHCFTKKKKILKELHTDSVALCVLIVFIYMLVCVRNLFYSIGMVKKIFILKVFFLKKKVTIVLGKSLFFPCLSFDQSWARFLHLKWVATITLYRVRVYTPFGIHEVIFTLLIYNDFFFLIYIFFYLNANIGSNLLPRRLVYKENQTQSFNFSIRIIFSYLFCFYYRYRFYYYYSNKY